MRSGSLRQRVQIQERSTARNGSFNEKPDVWATLETRWASIEPLTGREFISRSGEAADATHKVTIRPFAGLTPAHRILFGARIFDIQHVNNWQERGVYMQLICKERLA